VLGEPVTVGAIEQRGDTRIVAICKLGHSRQAIDIVDLPLPLLPPRMSSGSSPIDTGARAGSNRGEHPTTMLVERPRRCRERVSLTDGCGASRDSSHSFAKAFRDLSEIEKGTRRIVAVKVSANLNQAAALLGMAQVSLARWSRRRAPRANLVSFGRAYGP